MKEGLPDWAEDAIYVDTDIFLGWFDRVRVLLGARIKLATMTPCEHLPGRTESRREVRIYFWRPLPKGWGVMATPDTVPNFAGKEQP